MVRIENHEAFVVVYVLFYHGEEEPSFAAAWKTHDESVDSVCGVDAAFQFLSDGRVYFCVDT